jgi:hypothetical protein
MYLTTVFSQSVTVFRSFAIVSGLKAMVNRPEAIAFVSFAIAFRAAAVGQQSGRERAFKFDNDYFVGYDSGFRIQDWFSFSNLEY